MKTIGISFDNGKEITLENVKFENIEKAFLYGRPTVIVLDNKNEITINTSKIVFYEICIEEE